MICLVHATYGVSFTTLCKHAVSKNKWKYTGLKYKYRYLWVIGQYFFSQNCWPSLIICIDLFVIFLWFGGGCRYFCYKTGIR